MKPASACPHGPKVGTAPPARPACAECGETWSLRLCTDCGHVGCCDSSQRHARSHSKATGHRIIAQLPLSEWSFVWCYECDEYLEKNA